MLDSIENFRQVKADSVKKIINSDMYLLRGGPLDKVSESDINTLINDYNLKTVVDFRSSEENEEAKNIIIPGVDYYNLAAFDPSESICKNPTEFLRAYEDDHDLNFMEHLYSEFVLNEFTRNRYKEFLELVAESQGSVYFHCTAGKDRTGFAAMLLLEILGASDKDIYSDYLKTNESVDKKYEEILEILRKTHDYSVDDDHLKDLIGVKKEYLDHSKMLIHSQYETVLDFIKNGLGLDKQTLSLIRSKYLV